ncbi:hypothetical protein OOK60_14905 [Trichothermofontia sichuanensis B231]|uniref:hypothetical protein n=1 Tax=Trichothermofontia sichuanensis TaxID=3045816 RepID=UPI0022482604|nr:hypothetical protein [Trichothermofontia sichuanensis]UZQ53772.1 hypothetical protein OOK60_14905 [Trichothermofontia sichuanensis B231]
MLRNTPPTRQSRLCLYQINPRWRAIALALVMGMGSVSLIGGYTLPTQAQTTSLSTLTVQDAVGDQVYVNNQRARVGSQVRPGQTLRTENALMGFEFNTGAVGRLGRNAEMGFDRTCFQLKRGRMLVSGPVVGCTPTAQISTRNATYFLSVGADGREELQVLEGEVSVTSRRRPGVVLINLQEGQDLRLSPQGEVVTVNRLPRSDYDRLLRDDLLSKFDRALPRLVVVRDRYVVLYPGTPFPLGVATVQVTTPGSEQSIHPIDLQRAKNLARQTGERINGGLGRYQAEAAMHGPAAESPFRVNNDGTVTFTFKGGPPGFVTPTVESEIKVNPTNWTIEVLYNGPIR